MKNSWLPTSTVRKERKHADGPIDFGRIVIINGFLVGFWSVLQLCLVTSFATASCFDHKESSQTKSWEIPSCLYIIVYGSLIMYDSIYSKYPQVQMLCVWNVNLHVPQNNPAIISKHTPHTLACKLILS